jgi:hypothetical protein
MRAYDEKQTYRYMQQMAMSRGWRARMNPDEPRVGEDIPKFLFFDPATRAIVHGPGFSLTAREALGVLTGVLSSIGGDPILPPE